MPRIAMHMCSHSTTTMTPRGSRIRHQQVGDLRGQPLLHLRPPGEDLDQPGQLGQAGDPPVRAGDVADVRARRGTAAGGARRGSYTSMSRTSTISSWSASKVVVSTSLGSPAEPGEDLGVRAGHPGRGLPCSPSRSGSSPTAIRISRTARSIRSRSTASSTGRPVSLPLIRPGGQVVERVVAGSGVGRGDVPPGGGASAAGLAAVTASGPSRCRPSRPLTPSALACVLAARPARAGSAPAARWRAARLPKPSYGASGGRLTTRAQIRGHVGCRQGLLLHQLEHHVVQDVPVLHQDLPGLVVRQLDQRAHLAVDRRRPPPRSSPARGPCCGRGTARRSLVPYLIAPSFELMPYWVIIARASWVAFSMSLRGTGGRARGRPAPRRPGRPARTPACRSSRRGSGVLVLRRQHQVCPATRPRDRIVTLCTGSACGSAQATSACPPSWYAVIFFSLSLITRVRCCGPAMHPVDRLLERARC